jgi:hypothetical protein
MKTIFRLFYASVFVVCLVAGVAVVSGMRFVLSMTTPTKSEVTEQTVRPLNLDFPPEPSLVETQPAIFDPGEIYYPPEKSPQAFANIELLDIETREFWQDDGKYFNKPIVPTGYLRAGKDFKFKVITIADREITFETAEINDVSYRFVGHFPVIPQYEYCEQCEYPPDLKGKLTKLKNGKIVAEMNAEFYVSHC